MRTSVSACNAHDPVLGAKVGSNLPGIQETRILL